MPSHLIPPPLLAPDSSRPNVPDSPRPELYLSSSPRPSVHTADHLQKDEFWALGNGSWRLIWRIEEEGSADIHISV